VKPGRRLAIGLMSLLPWLSAMAEQPMTQLTVEQKMGGQRVITFVAVGDGFVASLTEDRQLDWLFHSDRKELWILDHDLRVAQMVNRTEARIIADRLASAVAEFKASIASLPDDQRILSWKRFEQLFETANRGRIGSVDEFVPENRGEDFAGIHCEWHTMIAHLREGERVVGKACLAETEAIANGPTLAALFSEVTMFSATVKNADTGPVNPLDANDPVALAAGLNMIPLKVIPNLDLYSPDVGMEVISVAEKACARGNYRIPDEYQRKRLSDSF